MATNEQPDDDYLPIVPGGVVCRAGGKPVGEGECVVSSTEDSRALVEDKLSVGSFALSERKEIFLKSPWKNYFLVELYDKPNINECVNRGTAFLTDLVRVEDVDGETYEYATFLTAAHVLFDHDRVVLKHSSELLKGGPVLKDVESFFDLRKVEPPNMKKGWFEVCPEFTDLLKHSTSPHDYGAIFVRKLNLDIIMDQYDMSGVDLLTVQRGPRPSALRRSQIFVAGYPLELGNSRVCTYLVAGEGRYRPLDSLPDRFVANKKRKKLLKLPAVDAHTADTSRGMSGSPVVLGEFPLSPSSNPQCEAIAIHVGGFRVDGKTFVWANDPDDFRNGLGVNLAVPITEALLEKFKLRYTR